MGKVKKFEPISAICKDCGRDFIITVEEQKRFKSLGFCEYPGGNRKHHRKAVIQRQHKGQRWTDKIGRAHV